ncbi:MAG: hypothetical protein Q9M94_06005 [Candidatus Gracilibacteria bacterium]|nr:hypothetical protein [Candidatus Gracilibacteria bacterium]MDQ7022858.1 hypothetical protein [Candidatus Gracilibacteria bacterium]
MNKVLILISILLGSILIITNFAASSGSVHIIIGWSKPGMLAIIGISIGVILGFGLKGFLSEKGGNDYNDDEGVNF